MTNDTMLEAIREEVARILAEKGEAPFPLEAGTIFLGGEMPFDSLDLATLVVAMEGRTGRDPFRGGFRQFTTAGELAALYAAA
ncbi:MAG TPA: acyl carrier protein [Azospirillaceae bacterium]|nr:acyl carrier protein [Azospirillaceae bacterium]